MIRLRLRNIREMRLIILALLSPLFLLLPLSSSLIHSHLLLNERSDILILRKENVADVHLPILLVLFWLLVGKLEEIDSWCFHSCDEQSIMLEICKLHLHRVYQMTDLSHGGLIDPVILHIEFFPHLKCCNLWIQKHDRMNLNRHVINHLEDGDKPIDAFRESLHLSFSWMIRSPIQCEFQMILASLFLENLAFEEMRIIFSFRLHVDLILIILLS